MPRYTASSNPDNQYSLDCREGPMKKNSLSVCLWVCVRVKGQRSKEHNHYDFCKPFLCLVKTGVASAERSGRGIWGGHPPQKSKYFFSSGIIIYGQNRGS